MCKMSCFRERLNQLLTDSGKTIVAFAEFLGTSRQSLGYYLNGERVPDALMVKQFCERCNVSADWLLGLSETKKIDADLRAAVEYTKLSEEAIETLADYNDQSERDITGLDIVITNKKLFSTFVHEVRALRIAHEADLAYEGERFKVPKNENNCILLEPYEACQYYAHSIGSTVSIIFQALVL